MSVLHQPWTFVSARNSLVYAMVVASAVCLAVLVLLSWHLYLVLSGQTTIEFYYNMFQKRQARKRGEVL
jgi:palmitoyltransferase